MVINNTNISTTEVTYLDLSITIKDNKYIYKSYDKRNDFNFNIINYPNLHGNIPIIPAYGVFISQLIRYSNINMDINDFKEDIKKIVEKFIQQGYNKNILILKYRHFCKQYIHKWAHFGVDIINKDITEDIF